MSVKDTSLLTVIVVKDMTQQAMNYASLSFDYVNTYTMLALFYLVLLSVLMILQKFVEKKFNLKK
jgi:ABC-type amino acid transport system permease subunit